MYYYLVLISVVLVQSFSCGVASVSQELGFSDVSVPGAPPSQERDERVQLHDPYGVSIALFAHVYVQQHAELFQGKLIKAKGFTSQRSMESVYADRVRLGVVPERRKVLNHIELVLSSPHPFDDSVLERACAFLMCAINKEEMRLARVNRKPAHPGLWITGRGKQERVADKNRWFERIFISKIRSSDEGYFDISHELALHRAWRAAQRDVAGESRMVTKEMC